VSARRLLQGVIAAIAIALISVLFGLSRSSDPGAHAQIVDLLRGLRESEEMLGRLLLQINTGRLLTYDPILATEQGLERSLTALRLAPALQHEPQAGLLKRSGTVGHQRRAECGLTARPQSATVLYCTVEVAAHRA
jgi:hypothetical protein